MKLTKNRIKAAGIGAAVGTILIPISMTMGLGIAAGTVVLSLANLVTAPLLPIVWGIGCGLTAKE